MHTHVKITVKTWVSSFKYLQVRKCFHKVYLFIMNVLKALNEAENKNTNELTFLWFHDLLASIENIIIMVFFTSLKQIIVSLT